MMNLRCKPGRPAIARKHTSLAATLIALAFPLACHAEPLPEEKLFDPPLAYQELDPTTGPHPQEALRCHWYADLMIRETQTDSPGTGPSYVVHPAPDGSRPICRAAPTARDTKLDLQQQTLIGRKGPYIVYTATDAPGPEPFIVLNLTNGRHLYNDQEGSRSTKTSAAGLHAVTLDGDTLHLRYQREYDTPCSLPKDGDACWTKSIQQGHLAHAIAAQPPPLADCRTAYMAAGAALTLTSAIVYDVDMTISPAGKITVLSRGPITCLPSD